MTHLYLQASNRRTSCEECVERFGNARNRARTDATASDALHEGATGEDGPDVNPYAILGSGVGTEEAASLCARLNAWHDAMVAHERRLRAGRMAHRCDDDCPHVEARTLWAEALATFGERANDLTFLRSRAFVASSRRWARRSNRKPRPRSCDHDSSRHARRRRTTRSSAGR